MAPGRRKGAAKGKAAAEDVRAVDGRLPGQRGRATRDKLLQCTAQLLEKTSYRDLRVIEIARCAGTSPATFYQYFPSVEEAVLALAGAMAEPGARLASFVRDSNWGGKGGIETAYGLVDGFFDLWERHRAVLRVVDLSTAEGDLRFQNIRTHLLNEVTLAMRDVIESFREQGRHPRDLEPMAHAAALVSMLAHVASHRYGFEFWGIRTENMRSSMARIVYTSVTGRRAPD